MKMLSFLIDYYLHDGDVMDYIRKIYKVCKMMDKRIVYLILFKIIQSRKYSNKEFKSNLSIIENRVIKKYI